ncbi:hypothetical protein B0H13DRAFT_2300636 [Mycena leptocephala]|nr:hypothetical protein B0H13DRAFT_2300636 [Mycena leptocephala]
MIDNEEDDEPDYSAEKLEEEFFPVAEVEPEEPEPSYLGNGDLEDAIGVEEPRGGFSAYIEINGQRMTKAKASRLRDLNGPRSSTDRTRRVASIPCFEQPAEIVEYEASVLGAPCLLIDNPIATLVRCEVQLFLAIGSVSDLSLGSQPLDEINLPLLLDASAHVSF